MYRKEIIYLGLYKDGSRIGNAGFLKVENRDEESRLFLKLQNIPYNIRGKFPIRLHQGSDWKEINGISVQEGGGSWEEKVREQAPGIQVQVMLPGGYLLEGRSKDTPQNLPQIKSMNNNQETGQKANEEVRQEVKQKASRETNEEVNEKVNREANKEVDREANKEVNREANKEVNREINKGVNREINKEVNWEANEKVNREVKNEIRKEIKTEIKKEADADRAEMPLEEGRPDRIPENTSADKSISTTDRTVFQTVETTSVRREGAYDAAKRIQIDPPKERQTVLRTEELQRQADREPPREKEQEASYSLKEDKWEQILETYEQIHPYGDERVYVKLEPKDFIILQAKYQHLVNNSFLLHGFYNYRYIILGKEQDYYLGVPGVFYEREKMVALMFGFEAFECPGGIARAGEFGYYLRKVEL